jgi:hypothetical protein
MSKPAVVTQLPQTIVVVAPVSVPAVKAKRIFGSVKGRKMTDNANGNSDSSNQQRQSKGKSSSQSNNKNKTSSPTVSAEESKNPVVELLFKTLRPRYIDTDFSTQKSISAPTTTSSSDSSKSSRYTPSSAWTERALLSVYRKAREILRVGGAQLVSSLVSVLTSGRYVVR